MLQKKLFHLKKTPSHLPLSFLLTRSTLLCRPVRRCSAACVNADPPPSSLDPPFIITFIPVDRRRR
jgi:hypothetical protein